MKRSGVKSGDLARTLAERTDLTEGQAQDELDRMVHRIVTSLRQGRRVEMPGVGTMTAQIAADAPCLDTSMCAPRRVKQALRWMKPAPWLCELRTESRKSGNACQETQIVNASGDAEPHIAEIVRESLARGLSVEIEGLGTFHEGNDGYEFAPQTIAQVFIAYAAEDLPHASRLCDALRRHGCAAWLDKEKLLPGQNWPEAIERAIEVSDVFVACFTPRSVSKRGMFQQELRHALECARRRPLDDSFLMPVRLEECRVPPRITDHVQYVDLFPNWERGVRWLARAIRKAGRKRPAAELAGSTHRKLRS